MAGMNFEDIQSMLAQAQQQGPTEKKLLEVRAGILNQQGTLVTPDRRKGKLVVSQHADGLLHISWYLRPSDRKELDLTIFQGTAVWEKVSECKTGRVYLLRFPGQNAKRFFWFQEPKDDKDDEWERQINEWIRNPPPPPQPGQGGIDNAELMNMLQQQRGMGSMGSLGGHGGHGHDHGLGGLVGLGGLNTGNQGTAGPSGNRGGASNTSTGLPPGGAQGQGGLPGQGLDTLSSLQAALTQQTSVQLEDVLNPEIIIPFLEEDKSIVSQLVSELPEGQQSYDELKQQLRSPQIQQAMERLSSVLNSGQYNTLMTSLGLQRYVTGSIGVLSFVDAVRREAEDKKKNEAKSAPKPASTSSTTSSSSSTASTTSTTSPPPSTPAPSTTSSTTSSSSASSSASSSSSTESSSSSSSSKPKKKKVKKTAKRQRKDSENQ